MMVAKSKAGRCRTGSDLRGKILHAVPEHSQAGNALCGARPGRNGGWSAWPEPLENVTCSKCKALVDDEIMDTNAFICEFGQRIWDHALAVCGSPFAARAALESGEYFHRHDAIDD